MMANRIFFAILILSVSLSDSSALAKDSKKSSTGGGGVGGTTPSTGSGGLTIPDPNQCPPPCINIPGNPYRPIDQYTPPIHFMPSSGPSVPIPTLPGETVDENDIVITGNKCVDEDENVKAAKADAAKGIKIFMNGELHDTVAEHYPDIVDALSEPGEKVCIAMELSPSFAPTFMSYAGSPVPILNGDGADYVPMANVLAGFMKSGMSVSFIDTAYPQAEAFANANFGSFLPDGVTLPTATTQEIDDAWGRALTTVENSNARDADMAEKLKDLAASGKCDKVISINGIKHLRDWTSGRQTLSSLIGSAGSVIDLTGKIRKCKK